MDEAIAFAPGWHRKWLLLLMALVALFLSRCRIMGMLLSALVTRQLAKKALRLQLEVRVRLVLLSPLQLVHVEVAHGSDWSLLFTRIIVHSRVKEFFRSFGQTKIWVLEIDSIVGELHHLDDNLLRELVQSTHTSTAPLSSTTPPADATNPVGILRFVDCRVASIRLTLRCFEAVSELRCRALAIGITDVLVDENLLFVKLQAANVFVRSYRAALSAHLAASSSSNSDNSTVIRDGVLLDCPSLCLVADLKLQTQRLVGVKLHGVKDEHVTVQLSTSFIEWVMHKRLELIRRGLFPVPSTHASAASKRAKHAERAVLTKEITDTSVAVVLVHDVDDHVTVPVRLTADIVTAATAKLELPLSALLDFADESDVVLSRPGVCHRATARNVSVAIGRELKQVILGTTSIEVCATQTDPTRGRIECSLGEIEMFMSSRVSTISQSLRNWSNRVKECAVASERALADAASSCEAQQSDLERLVSAGANRSTPVEWSVVARIASWRARAVIQAKHELAEELVVEGEKTTVTTTLMQPSASRVATTYAFEIDSIRADAITPFAHAKQRHRAVFAGAVVTVAKDRRLEDASTFSVDATFQSVSVNGANEDVAADGQAQMPPFPVAAMTDVHIVRHDRRTRSTVDSELSVSIVDSHVQWNHRTHATCLREWSAILVMIDKIDAMVSLAATVPGIPAASLDTSIPAVPPITKTFALELRAKTTSVQLYDVRDVAAVVALQLTESKVVHQKQPLAVQSSFECASLSLLWGATSPAIDVVSVKFAQKKLLGPQRLLARVPVQSSIRANQMKVTMRPAQRLLLLLLRFDELVNPKDASDSAHDPIERKATRQGVSFDCALLTLEIHGFCNTGSAGVDTESPSHDMCHVTMDALEIKSVVAKSFEISESVVRFVESMQQQLQRNSLDTAATVQPIGSALSVEGSVCANSVTALRSGTVFAHFQQFELQFAITNIARAASDLRLEKVTLFDISGLARGCDVTAERRLCEWISKLLPTVQETFDTREAAVSDSDPANGSAAAHWRLRYVGNIDCGLQQCVVNVPYGDSLSPILDGSRRGLGERLMRISIRDFALNFRQFQKLVVQLANFCVHLDTSSVPAATTLEAEPPLQLVSIPQLALNCMVHWKETRSDAEQQCSGASGGAASAARGNEQLFAVSFELSLKSRADSAVTTHVPMLDEVLIALNWDFVYPLLVHFLTDDDSDDGSNNDEMEARGATDERASGPRLRCVGVQWDVSIDMAQVAFWDAMTKDVALLLVANDLLSHGFAKRSYCLRHTSTAAVTPVTSPLLPADTSASAWTIYEATTYMDRCRAYVLRNFTSPDDLAAASAIESDVIPFSTAKVSNFFFETIGTSYRAIHSSSSPTAGSSTSFRDDSDEVHDLDTADSMFSDAVGPFVERLHDGFKPIEFAFSLFGSTKSRKSQPIVAVSLSNLSTMPTQLGGSGGSMPSLSGPPSPTQKPPRPWIQTVRAKLMRLKRRSSSMDNLLLNDGSCPIQVDSMKLLWTIETRDTVFYMLSLIVDSVQWLAEAAQSQQQQREQQQQQRQRARESDPPLDATSRSGPTAAAAAAAAPKIHSWRPAATVHFQSQLSSSSMATAPARRGSTRDTLLELLQQGKLGAKQVSYSPDLDGAQHSSSSSETRVPSSLGEGEDVGAARAIALKQYTLDIHDAQINIREENSQSSVLAATKHIHLEVGLDSTRSYTVAHLQFTSVTAHVAPIDVDISAGVVWYAQTPVSPAASPLRTQATSSSYLLQQVMDECRLSMTYSQALATGATAVEVDLSFLQLSADRHQFYQLLNVMRHVLLAPPTHMRKQRRQQMPHARTADGAADSDANELLVFPTSPSVSVQSLSSKKTHAQLLDELRSREAKQLNARTSVIALKCISFRVEGTRFRLRTSPEVTGTDHEFVEIRAEGVAGSHTYFSNQCTKLTLNLQWMEVTNLRPGSSSIAFDDAMAVLKAKLLLDKRYQSSSKVHLANQKGMLTIRAESGPLIRVLGQKLRVLDVLEVSVFPEIANMIVIQLAADFYDLVYKFFFEPIGTGDHHHHHDLNSEQVLFGRRAAAGHMSPSIRTGRAAATSNAASPLLSASASPLPLRRKSGLTSSSCCSSGAANAVSLVLDPSASYVTMSTTSSSTASTTAATSASESSALEDDDASTDGCELFYFKYVRIGNVRLRINCNGFFVNLSDFDLDLPPYVCQSKLCTWKKLLQRFESHLKWYVTKESASSGLSHFKNKFLKWPSSSASSSSAAAASSALLTATGASSSVSAAAAALLGATSDKKDKTKRDDDTSATNAQVLFGPYSGTAT